jgi:chorismate dehydratase
MSRVRLGAVSYLNTRPLVAGLDAQAERFDLRVDVPSRCATLLHEGGIDLGVIPSIEFLRGDYAVVPGIAIASEGPVASVAVFSRVPADEIRSLALDTSSRTSAALVQVLCAERFGIRPRLQPAAPDLDAMLAACDAALLIGDPALFADHERRGLLKIDLGAEWTAHTGLPFVWAFWAGRPEACTGEVCDGLRSARDLGMTRIPEIAAAFAGADLARRRVAERYLREHVHFHLGPRHAQALERFYASAASVGVVPAARPLRLAGSQEPARARG